MEYLKSLLKGKAMLLFFFLQFLHFGIFSQSTFQNRTPPKIELTLTQKEEFEDLNKKLSAATQVGDKARAMSGLVAFFALFDAESTKFYTAEIARLLSETNDEQAEAFHAFAKGVNYAQQNDFEKALECSLAHLNSIKKLDLDSVTMLKGFYLVADIFSDLGQADSAVFYLKKAENFVPKNEQNYFGDIYSLFGLAYNILSESEKSIDYKRKAIAIKKKFNDASVVIDEANLGSYYFGQNKFGEALEVWLSALEFFEKAGNTKNAFQLCSNISVVMTEMENLDGAKEYLERGMKIAEEAEDQLGIIDSFLGLSKLESHHRNYEKAIDYVHKAKNLAQKTGNQVFISTCYYDLGLAYYNLNQLDSAEYYLNICTSLYEKEPIPKLTVYYYASLGSLGVVYFNQKKYKKAIQFLEESIDWNEKNETYVTSSYETFSALAEAYEAVNNHEQALNYLKRSSSLKDSLFNVENIQEIAELKKDAEFKTEKEKTELQHQAELEREALIQKGLLIGLGMLALLLFVIYRNYRNSKKANQIIQNQKTELEQLNQTKDQIFAVLGHDLRKPAISFRGITAKMRRLIGKKDFDKLAKLGQVIEENAFSLTKLTDNLLNWALNEKNAINYRPIFIPVAEMVEELFELFNTIAADKKINLISNIPEDLKVFADLSSFDIILRNLVDNALKFTHEGGTVELSAKPEKESIEISVKDSGIGISENKLKDLFVLKNNKSERGTASEKGTGLGLHLVKELVKLNRGLIKVSSQAEKGSDFQLVFPKVGSAANGIG